MGEKTALSQCSSNNILMTRYERILRGGAAACSNIAGRSQVYQRSLQIYVEAQGLSATFLQVKHSTFYQTIGNLLHPRIPWVVEDDNDN